jgi:hypothetical protein
MNIETKYFLRWGIPGWVFILLVSIMGYLIFHTNIKMDEVNLIDFLGLLVSAGFVGVPVGYLFHQIYFSYNWLGNGRIFDKAVELVEDKEKIKGNCWGQNGHLDYFRLEHVWQKELVKLQSDEKRTYLTERYRHLLTTIHGLGALWVALALSLGINVLFSIYHFNNIGKMSLFFLGVLALFNLYLLIAVQKGFVYYSDNLNYFQGHFLNAFFNNEIEKKEVAVPQQSNENEQIQEQTV